MTEPVATAYRCGHYTGFKHNNEHMSEICVLTQNFRHKTRVLSRPAAAHRGDHQAAELRVLSRTGTQA